MEAMDIIAGSVTAGESFHEYTLVDVSCDEHIYPFFPARCQKRTGSIMSPSTIGNPMSEICRPANYSQFGILFVALLPSTH
jgi:hypothetical protein